MLKKGGGSMERNFNFYLLLTVIGAVFAFLPRSAFGLFELFFGSGAGLFVSFLDYGFSLAGVILVSYVLYKLLRK
jgi:hypothetical protein